MHWRWVEDLEVDKLNEVLLCINNILDKAWGSEQYMNKGLQPNLCMPQALSRIKNSTQQSLIPSMDVNQV
jgi:hypothetical protein